MVMIRQNASLLAKVLDLVFFPGMKIFIPICSLRFLKVAFIGISERAIYLSDLGLSQQRALSPT